MVSVWLVALIGTGLLIGSVCCVVNPVSGVDDCPVVSVEEADCSVNRFRLVAFCSGSLNAKGYYSIELWTEGGWRQVQTYIGDPFFRWNPVLEFYEDAKRLAESWKDKEVFAEWVLQQHLFCTETEAALASKRAALFPVESEVI